MSQFNFKGGDQQKKVGQLSGGERNRVHLAKMLKSGVNVLLLDEPTNDLDVDTLRALEDGLADFAGCAVVISHDRWFLTASPPTSWPSKATARWCGSKATSTTTKKTKSAAWAKRPCSPTASSTSR
jgi:ATPase subunit of ABC transporter with duplicated ATPase domains